MSFCTCLPGMNWFINGTVTSPSWAIPQKATHMTAQKAVSNEFEKSILSQITCKCSKVTGGRRAHLLDAGANLPTPATAAQIVGVSPVKRTLWNVCQECKPFIQLSMAEVLMTPAASVMKHNSRLASAGNRLSSLMWFVSHHSAQHIIPAPYVLHVSSSHLARRTSSA